ncbi:Uncharacterized [Syntrophomonas zehnderi OL-4]|uniref:Uncharacterized n=1 Tax=Syntrophomonas zehnderi OL-4 TaxID=690567 RepID=A0A0E4G9E1_9FIRM|nr:Uncharacterized [Syntrophomonas zehnderi OL-4]
MLQLDIIGQLGFIIWSSRLAPILLLQVQLVIPALGIGHITKRNNVNGLQEFSWRLLQNNQGG